MIQNLWDTAKVVLTGKFIVIQAYLKKQEKSQRNNLTLHLKELEKEEQTKPKVSRRRETIKNTAEINEIETKKATERINETKSWFSEKINKSDEPLARHIKKKKSAQINKIRSEKEVTPSPQKYKGLQEIITNNYVNKMDNIDEIDKFLEMYNFPRLNQEEMDNLSRPITSNEISIIKKLTTNKSPGPDGFTGEFYQKFI